MTRYEYRRERIWRAPAPEGTRAERMTDAELDALLARVGAEGWRMCGLNEHNVWFVREYSWYDHAREPG